MEPRSYHIRTKEGEVIGMYDSSTHNEIGTDIRELISRVAIDGSLYTILKHPDADSARVSHLAMSLSLQPVIIDKRIPRMGG